MHSTFFFPSRGASLIIFRTISSALALAWLCSIKYPKLFESWRECLALVFGPAYLLLACTTMVMNAYRHRLARWLYFYFSFPPAVIEITAKLFCVFAVVWAGRSASFLCEHLSSGKIICMHKCVQRLHLPVHAGTYNCKKIIITRAFLSFAHTTIDQFILCTCSWTQQRVLVRALPYPTEFELLQRQLQLLRSQYATCIEVFSQYVLVCNQTLDFI